MTRKPAFWLFFSLTIGLASQAWAQTFGTYPGPYLPDGPYVPTVTLTLGNEGAAGLPPDKPPPPNGFDQQSIWNMRVVGFNDNQGRASSDDGWIEDQNGRYIAYVADSPGSATNPLTGQIEQNGTSLIDVTKPAKPVFVHHIPSIFPARQWPSSAKNSSMRSSNCTAFAISASGIGLLASDPGCKLTVSRAVPTRTALEFARDFRGAERPNRQEPKNTT